MFTFVSLKYTIVGKGTIKKGQERLQKKNNITMSDYLIKYLLLSNRYLFTYVLVQSAGILTDFTTYLCLFTTTLKAISMVRKYLNLVLSFQKMLILDQSCSYAHRSKNTKTKVGFLIRKQQ